MIVVVVIIVAMAFAYVIPLTTLAAYGAVPETPPPEYGTDMGDFDDSTLPAPWLDEDDEEEDDTPEPMLIILDGPLRLNVKQSVIIQYEMKDFPEDVFPEWTSSNEKVAVVGTKGELLAVAPGTAEIVVKAGMYRSSVFVTVNELSATAISIIVDEDATRTGSNHYELKVGDVIRLTSVIDPAGAKVDKIVWTVSDDKVASISPNGQVCEFVADSIGQTQVTVSAGKLSDAIAVNIIESGVPLSKIWEYIRLIVVVIVVVVAIIIVLNVQKQKREKEKARQRALAKRRREEAERRARAEEELRMREEAAPDYRQDPRELRAPQTEHRETMKVSGTVVGAGVGAPPEENEFPEPERPVTLDDLI